MVRCKIILRVDKERIRFIPNSKRQLKKYAQKSMLPTSVYHVQWFEEAFLYNSGCVPKENSI